VNFIAEIPIIQGLLSEGDYMFVRRWPAYSAIASFVAVAVACLIGLGWNAAKPASRIESAKSHRAVGREAPQLSIPDPVERTTATQGS
jgi:hypothetical protein